MQAPNLDGRRTTACGLGIAETQSCADCIATGPHAHHSAPTRCTHRCGTDQSLQSRPPAYCGDDTKSESVVATRAPATHAESNKPSMIKQATAARQHVQHVRQHHVETTCGQAKQACGPPHSAPVHMDSPAAASNQQYQRVPAMTALRTLTIEDQTLRGRRHYQACLRHGGTVRVPPSHAHEMVA